MKIFKTFIFYFLILIFTIAFTSPLSPSHPSGWYQQFMPNLSGRQIADITFADSLRGYAITTRLSSTDTSFVLKTSNGGDNCFVTHSDSGVIYSWVQFINQNTGFVGGLIYKNSSFWIIKTTNAGLNWFYINAPFDVAQNDMYVLNEDTIWIADQTSSFGGVFRTTNGGVNWENQYPGPLNPDKIYMYDRNIGFFSRLNTFLFKTTNSGSIWTQISGIDGFIDIYFADNLTGWKVNSQIKKTTNGGLNWITQITPFGGILMTSGAIKLSGLSIDTLWAVGAEAYYGVGQTRGVIYRTTNGGDNWLFQVPDTNIHISTYYSFIQFIDKNHGWAFTQGLLGGVHTTTGGDPIWLTETEQISTEIPSRFKLCQNYPNPFNPRTVIPYSLSAPAHVKIIAYDITGREVQRMVDSYQQAGAYEVDFMGKFIASGVYLYRMIVDDRVIDTKKMILIK
jgi:photosystem II stability/assembly factor-like uncharacterized protein